MDNADQGLHEVFVVTQTSGLSKFGPKLASHYKPVENEVKSGLSEPYSAN